MLKFRRSIFIINRLFLRGYVALLEPMEINRILAKSSVRTSDTEHVGRVLSKVFEMGSESLHVVTDFDYTISKPRRSDGSANCTTHGVLDSVANGVQPALQAKLRDLREKYYPIEMDPCLSADEKLPHMECWWRTAHTLISNAGFSQKLLRHYVDVANVELRDGALEFLRLAEDANIPVVIFSAGIGDLIEMILRNKYGRIPENVHIISNMVQFNESGALVDFYPPLIHTFNKNCSVVQHERPFFERLKSRPNVLLLGDTLGDLTMNAGARTEEAVLKVGFLNQRVEESLPAYLAGYDIVLANDNTFDVPLALLEGVLGSSKTASV